MSNQEVSYHGQVGYLDSCCYYRFVFVVAGILLALAADVWGQSQATSLPQHTGAICRPLPETVQPAATTQGPIVTSIETSETLRRPTRRQTQLVRVRVNDQQAAVPTQTPQSHSHPVSEQPQEPTPTRPSALPIPLEQQLQQQHQQQELDALLEIRKRLGGGVREQLGDLFDSVEIEQEFREQLAQIIGRSEQETSPQPTGPQSPDWPMKITDQRLPNPIPQHATPPSGNLDHGSQSARPAVSVPGHNGLGNNVPGSDGPHQRGPSQNFHFPNVSGPIASQLPPPNMGVPGMPTPPNAVGLPGALGSFQPVPHFPAAPHVDHGRIRMVARQMDQLAADLEDLQRYQMADELRRNAQQLRESLRQGSSR